MRICLISVAARGLGGMQGHTRTLAHGLVDAGHEVEVITSRQPDLVPKQKDDGVLWHFVDAEGSFTDRNWLRLSSEAFLRIHNEQPFDIAHGEGSAALGLVRRNLHRRLPFVVMFHGNFLGHAKAAIERGLRHPSSMPREMRAVVSLSRMHFRRGNWYRFRQCEAIVPSRQQLNETRWSHLLNRSRVHVVPNGVDADVFAPRAQAAARAELGMGSGPLFVCAGRVARHKGMDCAIRALASLGDDSAHLAVIGDGPELDQMRELASELGASKNVLFCGPQPQERVATYLNAADVFLFPTTLNEAAPLVLLEAMSCSLPVIATETGAIPELVDRHEESGLLVPPGNDRALAGAMDRLIHDPQLRRRMGDFARSRVLANYTVELMTARTVEVYELAKARFESGSSPVH